MSPPKTIYTIGHSTRPLNEFIKILEAYGIKALIDVRTIARSRFNPQYNEEAFKACLSEHFISYARMKGLGGLRHTTKESINQAWRNSSFRGYADYMQTPEFTKNIKQLIKVSKDKITVIMCAEAVPWRCHRSLIGDALVVRKIPVEDILSEKNSQPHKLTLFAKIDGTTISYPKQM